ncbi:hypothetical protein CLV62_101480 [Dysgonomonas alginatilytica]|uniref:Serine aminopeptidase S33 domain-containing protein n=1 Tax=Dysgonomonas alginatilytica TaxID=1605892 RepID=A0A2V3PWH8_9BACT|nr:alpha/beta fold hydrolase [Dysgonomonas alginatilytica]PXV69211.1 hypothetical protein CLV62_101480 [Dysgonomonas alginatilytica]
MSQKKTGKKSLLKLLYLIIALFVLLNVFAAIQAYSMTHFVENSDMKKADVEFSAGNAVKAIVFGIDLPRPKSDIIPDRPYENVTIPAEDGNTLEAWVMPTDSVSKGMVILFHGYGDEKSSMLSHACILLDMGYDVLMPNFMGSGNSYGNGTTLGYLEAKNVKQTYDYAVSQLNQKHITLLGFSMGAAAITKAQHDYNMAVDGIILEAPYGSMLDAVSIRMGTIPVISKFTAALMTFWGGKLSGFNAFEMNPEEYVKTVNTPTLMMYGGQDLRIPGEESVRIFDNISSKDKTLHMFPEAKHEDYTLKYPQEWKNIVSNFLSTTSI